MPPKAAKQAIALQRSKKQQQQQEIWEEESWESQAEEDEDLEEWEEEEEYNSLEEEEEGIEDGATATKPSLSTEASPPNPTVSKSQKASRRWDNTETSTAASNWGKNRKQTRRGYCSWRAHKSNIVACLQHCGGNISFARRYLLFHDGVAIPRNVLHYYRNLYSPFEAPNKEATCGDQAVH
ncbi:22 kDa protein [Human adenovirus 18]|uniref:22 kDa protein n=1 Tax=Human adenovirus A serotype 18 TaxID=10528 RepID=D3JIT5_ADE18|nr:22 kDa protein [Human adenovirus 18]